MLKNIIFNKDQNINIFDTMNQQKEEDVYFQNPPSYPASMPISNKETPQKGEMTANTMANDEYQNSI